MKPSTRLALTSLLVLSLTPAAGAREVHVPLRLDHEFLRRTLLENVFTGPDNTALVWQDADGCNRLTLSDPALDSVGERIRVRSAAAAAIGTAVGGDCVKLLEWSGFVDVVEDVVVDADLPIVRFRVADSSVYGGGLQKTWTSLIWDWVKQYVHPRLEATTVDLHQPLDDLKAVLPSFLAAADAERTRALLDSLRIGSVKVAATGLEVDVRFDLPAVAEGPAASPAPEPTLTVDELVRWQEAWQRWGAFLTFVIKHAARDTLEERHRRTLLAVLLDARYDLIEALTSEETRGSDPVRRLFLRAWHDLAPVLRDLGNTLPEARALQYLGFIAAADALGAIDQLEPDTGIEISADGLRRLARIIAPASGEDPLRYDLEVDPELRDLFGFGPPLPPPEPTPQASLDSWLRPAAAWAGVDAVGDLVAQLRRWVPKRPDLPRYLPMMRDLLNLIGEETLDSKAIDVKFQPLFRWLTLATAWQESCWRQFIERDGAVRTLTSPAGSLGIMQVNPHVWRGFYNVEGLRQDVGYNARAGCEILAHYLNDYAVAKGEHKATGSVDNLARATYAVYNGGPAHLRRYRKPSTAKSLKRIDAAFWEKFKKVKSGHELAVAECYES